MHRKIVLLMVIIMMLMASNLYGDDCPLKGKWKSDVKLTLQDIKKNNNLSQKQIEYLSKKVFGKLKVEFTCDEIISDDEGKITKSKYDIIEKKGNLIRIRYFDQALGERSENLIELEGDCYYVTVETLHFREAMCRIEK